MDTKVVGMVTLIASLAFAHPAVAVDTTWTFNGDGNWNDNTKWSNGAPFNSTFNATIDDGDSAVTVTLNINTTTGTLTIGADDKLSFADTFDLTVAGASVVNNGIIFLNATSAANTDLNFTAPVATLSGTGRLVLGGASQNRVTNSALTNELINSTTHTIEGGGQLGVNGMKITNQGLIDANISASTITIDPSNSNAFNTGTMRASNGGILRLQGGIFTNTGGTIRALTASTVQIVGGSGAAGATINGGTLETAGTGSIQIVDALTQGPALQDVTVSTGSLLQMGDGQDITLVGTITNNGTIEQNSSTQLNNAAISGNVTLSGTGVWKMSNASTNGWSRTGGDASNTLTNDTNHTIQGAGALGSNQFGLVNKGLIDANQSTSIIVDPSTANVVNQNTGVLRGSGSGGLQLTAGSYDNRGTIEALNGSSVTYSATGVASNNVAGVLTGGTWRSVSTGGGATITLRGSNITQIANGTTVELSGVGSVLQNNSTAIDSTLTTNNGTLRILNGRAFNASSGLTSSGTIELGGVGLAGSTLSTTGSITNAAGATITGHGTITNNVQNSGTVRASGGTLGFISATIQGQSGTIQIDPAATLDLSGGNVASNTGFLIYNGAGLNLGPNFNVGADYTNANFGVGNAFNPRANVTGPGLINANNPPAQVLQGNVANGSSATATMSFGNIHVGDAPTLNYQIANVNPAAGPSLRGAIQTSVGGANLNDARLAGAGVTAGNFGPIVNAGASGNLTVKFTGSSAGALAGQQVHIVNNFDNVADQTLQITGAAYRLANPSSASASISFGIVHMGDPAPTQTVAVTNNVPVDGFSESLNASIGSASGGVTTNGGSFTGLPPGATDNTSLSVSISTATAGSNSGAAKLTLTSNGVGSSGLASTSLPSQTVNISGQVNNFAHAALVKQSSTGTFVQTDATHYQLNLGAARFGQSAAQSATLSLTNDAAAPADTLAGTWTQSAPNFNLSGFNAFASVAAGSSVSGLQVQLGTGALGTYNGQIVLHPRSQNPQPFDDALSDITISFNSPVVLPGDFNRDNQRTNADLQSMLDALKNLAAYKTANNFSDADLVVLGDLNSDSAFNAADISPLLGLLTGVGSATAVPEPASKALMALALPGLVCAVFRRRRKIARYNLEPYK